MRKGWTEQEIRQSQCYTAAVAVCWEPVCWKMLISPWEWSTNLVTLHPSRCFYPPAHLSSPPHPFSVSFLAVPQAQTAARPGKPGQRKHRRPRGRVWRWVCRRGHRGLVRALALSSPSCRQPGPPARRRLARGRWLPSPGPSSLPGFQLHEPLLVLHTQPWVADMSGWLLESQGRAKSSSLLM